MEKTLGYGLDTGLYESFLDGLEKNYGVENVNSLNSIEEPTCHGLFTELGFSEEIPAPGWSLVEQLGLAPGVDNPSLADIVDEACSPLSVVSGSGETCFQDYTCLSSPLSDSGVSCNSSYGNTEIEELDSGVWGTNEFAEEIDWSTFHLMTEATQEKKPTDVIKPVVQEDSVMVEETVPCNQINAACNSSIDITEPVRCVEVSAKSVAPLLAKNQKVFIVKAIPVRQAPYTTSKPAKRPKSREQKERKKNQNRDAALRYRSKKKEELDQLFDEADAIEKSNVELANKVTEMSKEISYLKSLMLDVIKAKLARSQNQTS